MSSSSTTKVAVVIPTHWDYRMGGSQFQAKLLIERLYRSFGARVAYFTARARRLQFEDHRVIPVREKRFLRRYGHFWDYFELQSALAEFAPDVVYQRVACAYTGIAAKYAKKNNVPMVWHMANEHDAQLAPSFISSLARPHVYLEAQLKSAGARTADVVVAQTEYQSRMLEDNYGRTSDHVIRNFLPMTNSPMKSNASLQIVWVANFKSSKQPEKFLELAEALRNDPQINLTMIGQPYSTASLQTELDARIDDLPNLNYVGPVSQETVGEWLDRAHLLVNTSKWEGFSNTFIQAWIRSVPVLTLGVDPDGLLSQGEIGRKLESVQEIANSIREFAKNPDMLVSIGRNCREFAVREFSMDNAEDLAALIIGSADNCPANTPHLSRMV